jgi:YVTN family beta-propeller protein
MQPRTLSFSTFVMLLVGCALALSLNQESLAQDGPGYHVLRSIHIGGEGGWDYIAVNPELRRIYVSHGMLVNILDESTGDSVGVIPNTPGVHGIAFAPSFGKGYTSNGRANTVSVFNLQTNDVLSEVKTGQNPDAIMYEPFSKTIFVCDGRSHDATVIDPSSDTVLTVVPLGGKPEAPVSDGAGNIYVNIEDKSEVAHISAKTFTVEHRWTLGKGESPSGIAMDRSTGRLFVGCDNKLMVVVDARSGAVVAQLPIGEGCDGVAFDPETRYAFSSNREGTLTMVYEESPDSFRVVANVPTKRGARTLTFDEKTHHIFLPTAELEPPPPPTKENPRPRPRIVPGTFEVLEVGR